MSEEITREEADELVSYVMGDSIKPPKDLEKMMINLYQKLQLSTAYTIAQSIKRQQILNRFIERAEAHIYDLEEQDIEMMDPDILQARLKEALSDYNAIGEYMRRFLAQNRELAADKTEQEKIAERLMALPPDKLSAIMSQLEGNTEEFTNSDDEEV